MSNGQHKNTNNIAIVLNDTIRLLTIFGIVHILEARLSKKHSLFNRDFLFTMLFFIIGTAIYHLIIKKFALFDETNNIEMNNNNER